MFRFLFWDWGDGPTPIVLVAGPQWAWEHNVHPHRVMPMFVQVHHVDWGRTYNIDPSLETFRFEESY